MLKHRDGDDQIKRAVRERQVMRICNDFDTRPERNIHCRDLIFRSSMSAPAGTNHQDARMRAFLTDNFDRLHVAEMPKA